VIYPLAKTGDEPASKNGDEPTIHFHHVIGVLFASPTEKLAGHIFAICVYLGWNSMPRSWHLTNAGIFTFILDIELSPK